MMGRTENGKTTFKREHWYEWLYFPVIVKYIYEGGVIPRFYLPVKIDRLNNHYECWFFLLAPFVLLLNLLACWFKHLWADLAHTVRDISSFYKK